MIELIDEICCRKQIDYRVLREDGALFCVLEETGDSILGICKTRKRRQSDYIRSMTQGKYDIRRLNGEAIISNARGFSSVANTVSQQAAVKLPSAVEHDQSAAQADTLPLADFLQSVRGMVEE